MLKKTTTREFIGNALRTALRQVELLAISRAPPCSKATHTPRAERVRPGAPCTCGSGKKSKKCCAAASRGAPNAAATTRPFLEEVDDTCEECASQAPHYGGYAAKGGDSDSNYGSDSESMATTRKATSKRGAPYEVGHAEALRLAREAESRRVAEKKRRRDQVCDGLAGAKLGAGAGDDEAKRLHKKAHQEAVRLANKAERDAAKETVKNRRLSAVYRDKGSDRKRNKAKG